MMTDHCFGRLRILRDESINKQYISDRAYKANPLKLAELLQRLNVITSSLPMLPTTIGQALF
jgi:hypothetical protein